MSPQIPDPFFVELLQAITAVETELKNLTNRLDGLSTKPEVEALKTELALHRVVIAGFFTTLVTLCGWIIAR